MKTYSLYKIEWPWHTTLPTDIENIQVHESNDPRWEISNYIEKNYGMRPVTFIYYESGYDYSKNFI